MKLCLVTPGAPRFLGLGNYITTLVPQLLRSHEIDDIAILADRTAQTQAALGGAARMEACWDADSPAGLWQVLAAIRRQQPDLVWFNTALVLGNTPTSNMFRLMAPALTSRLGLRTIVTLHNMIEAGPVGHLQVSSLPFAQRAGRLATSMLFKAETVCLTLQRYVRLAQRHYAAGNTAYVPLHVYGPPEHPSNVPGVARRVLYFGLNAPFKGLDVLAEAFPRVAAGIPGAELRIAGARHPRFRIAPAVHGQTPGIAWLGEVPERQANELMAWADVVVVPSLASTGASSVIHRAARQGKAIVASDLPDFRALSDDEGFAIDFCAPGDAEALAASLLRVCLDQDRRQSANLMNLAAAARLTPERVAHQYLALFAASRRTVLASSQPAPGLIHLPSSEALNAA